MEDYLHICRREHADLSRLCFGRTQQFHRVEEASKRIRSRRRLTYDDLTIITDEQWWNAGSFWRWPNRDEIEEAPASTHWDLWNLPKHEQSAVDALVDAFKFIEPASVILRFVCPEHYGILSAPVEKALEVSPSSSLTAKYLAYVRDLRELRDTRGFSSAADVDMALWVLQVGVVDGRLEGSEHLRRQAESDPQLRRLRACNLTRSLFNSMSYLEIAESLVHEQPVLSARLAAVEFEASLRELAGQSTDLDLKDIIDDLARKRVLSDLDRGLCHRGRYLRNRAAHGVVIAEPDVRFLVQQAKLVQTKTSS